MNPPTGSSGPDAPPAADGTAVDKVGASFDVGNLKPGGRWRGLYQVGEQLSDVTYGRVLKALHVGSMNEVLIRLFKVRDGLRAKAWNSLCRAQNGNLLEFVEALEFDGRRIEIVQAAPVVTLREWLGRKAPTPPELLLVVKQMSEAVGCMHRHGVVHLNLRTDTIFVRHTDGGMTLLIGSFEKAQVWEGETMPAEIAIDPFYSPPEAVGTFTFPRDGTLRGWDWWAVGRIVQEVILGRHVLGLMLERDVTKETPELKARAEALLKEENHMVRAGAVEMMPAMDVRMNTLLRGLLTSSRDGRWGCDEVAAWLRKETVKERYHLPKNERLFIWKDRAFTLAEAGEYFSQPQHWSEGLENLFEPTNVASLVYFLGREASHAKTKERVDTLFELAEAQLLKPLPEPVVRDVLASLILKFLAGHGTPLSFRGRRVDEAFIRAQLEPEEQPDGLAIVHAFIAHPVAQQIEQMDAETGCWLDEIGRIAETATSLAERNRWLWTGAELDHATLLRLCLDSELALSAVRAEMQKRYACTRDPVLNSIFKKADPSRAELSVLAYTNRLPEKYGYVTHQQWNEEQYAFLKKRGEQYSAACSWVRLARALLAGPLVFGRFRMLLPFWLLFSAAVAWVWHDVPGCLAALVCAVAGIGARLFWTGVHGQKLQACPLSLKPWRLRSGAWHCRIEAEAAFGAARVPSEKELLRVFGETNDQIAKLDLDPKPKPMPLPLRFKSTWIVSVISWIVVALAGLPTLWEGMRHPPKLPAINFAVVAGWFSSSENDKPKLSLETTSAGGMKSMQAVLDDLRRAKKEAGYRDVKMSWPFKSPQEAQYISIRETAVALPEQTKIAEEMAALILDRYDTATIKDIVAVQVPVEKEVGLMLYSAKTGKIVGKKVYVVGFVPMPKSWLLIEGEKVLFLNGR
jgi:serine/threonine protein kinase